MTKPPASAARSVPESIAATLASEIAAEHLKPGARMPAMKVTGEPLDQLVDYLMSLK